MSLNEAIPSELEVLRQRNAELEAKNVELEAKIVELDVWRQRAILNEEKIAELKDQSANLVFENLDLKNKVAKLEQEHKSTVEDLKRKDTDLENRLAKVEQGSPSKDEQPQVETLTAEGSANTKTCEASEDRKKRPQDFKRLISVPEEHDRRRLHKKKGMDELKHELFNFPEEGPKNNETEITETARPGEDTYDDKSNIDEVSQHLAQLCDKAFVAEDRANRASQEEILCWSLYWKDFRAKLDEIISKGEFGEKKARSVLYDSISEQLSLLRKQRSQELGLQLRDISRDNLRKKSQRAEKIYKFFEKVGLDKIKYIKSYSANSIAELTDEQIQEVIDYGISSEKSPEVTNYVTEITETARPGKIESASSSPQTSPAKVEPEDADLDSDDPDKEFFAAWENSREVKTEEGTNEAKADEYEPEADLDSDDPDKDFFAAWENSREARSEGGTNGPKTANYYDDAFMKRFDDNSGDEAFERGCRNSIQPEADESSDEEIQNEPSASSSSSDSDSDESKDSNHLTHYESEDGESENETSVSSPNSDTVYDESDAEREEESKNETPQITDEDIFAAFRYYGDIGTEDGQSDRSESIDHPKHDILREVIIRSEGISVQS